MWDPIKKKIFQSIQIKPEQYLKNRNQLDFLIAHISNEELLDIINQLENKSTGPQSIPTIETYSRLITYTLMYDY